jgi:hypothetical protein
MPTQNTPILSLPYPDESMPADVPTDMQKLAVALDTAVPSTNDPRFTGNLRTANNLSELTTTRKAALASLGIVFGNGSFQGSGLSHAQVTIPHGLAVTPTVYGATPVFEGFVKVVSADATNIVLQFDVIGAAGAQNTAVQWSSFVASSRYYFQWWAFA